jgi:hypothetical protein
VNLKEWARLQGIHPQTAYRWFREGTLPVPAVALFLACDQSRFVTGTELFVDGGTVQV